MQNHIPSNLSDDQLLAEVKRFAGCEREATVQLVAHLAELDTRGLHLAAGFSSLFKYCCEVLHRIEAARLARRFPVVLDLLADGSVNLTALRLLSPHLTDENHQELLAAASHQSKREVEELAARRAPRPDVASSVRKVPVRKVVAVPLPAPADDALPSLGFGAPSIPTAAPTPPPRHPVVAPLAPDRYEVKFTVSAATRDKLRRAQDLLRHAVPTGDPAEIVDRALTLLLEDLARKKFVVTERPRGSRGVANGSRHIPAEVKRAVWLRDGGRCAFVARNGRRCNGRGLLEMHHLKPYATGGEATVNNIELRCRPHNAYEAELFFEGMVKESVAPYCVSVEHSTRSGTGAPRGTAFGGPGVRSVGGPLPMSQPPLTDTRHPARCAVPATRSPGRPLPATCRG